MSKHTPGPWILDSEEALVRVGLPDPERGPDYICLIGDNGNDFGNAWDDDFVDDEIKANARLIAAAPDMREVCESVKELASRMITLFEKESFVFDGSGGRWEKLAFTLYSNIVSQSEKARAILDEAEGNEPR